MSKYFWLLIVLITLFGCKEKKKLSGNEHIDTDEFFNAYETLKLPFTITDTNIAKVGDTSLISYAIFTQFIPDSIFNNPFGKDRKITIRPIGKIELEDKETYLATLVTSKNNAAIYLSVYDKNKFMANMPLVVSNQDEKLSTATIDKKLSIGVNTEWTIKDDIFYNRIIYAYNNVGLFTTVLTETNEDRRAGKIVSNPIDTFPKKYKYSGDYVKGTKSIVSVRDGKNTSEYLFFVYFESGNEEDICSGEIRGVMKMTSEKAGVYQGEGDPCKLDFNFTGSQVKVTESGSCGNYRGIKCFFNDTFSKRKEAKTVQKKKQG